MLMKRWVWQVARNIEGSLCEIDVSTQAMRQLALQRGEEHGDVVMYQPIRCANLSRRVAKAGPALWTTMH